MSFRGMQTQCMAVLPKCLAVKLGTMTSPYLQAKECAWECRNQEGGTA